MDKVEKDKVIIYTDGACSGNPGHGGYAAIVIEEGKAREVVGAEKSTTNNRMEMMAVISALESLRQNRSSVVHSDSAYVVNAYNENWVTKWKRNGWKTASGESVKNIDLWQRLDNLKEKYNVQFIKVKGHSDNEYNNRCDKLAVDAIKNADKDESTVDEEQYFLNKVFGDLPILETERLKLRLFEEKDLDDLYEYCSDPEVTKWLSFETYLTKDEAVDRLKFLKDSYKEIKKPINWAIEYKENGKMIGGIDYVGFNFRDKCGEIGYCLNKDYWNKGIMTEAVKEVIKFGFEKMDLQRAEIRCDERNVPSYKVMEKAGLKYEGTLRKSKYWKGEYRSIKVYSILKEEYYK